MTVSARILFGLCLVCASATAAAADADKSACVQREMNEGHDARTSEAICGIKRFFQNRIRSKPDEEPVEMTVGAPPMVSDDTDTRGAGNLEINSVFDAELSSDRQMYEAPLLDINYGIGDRLQFRYEVPFVIDRNSPAGGPDRMSASPPEGCSLRKRLEIVAVSYPSRPVETEKGGALLGDGVLPSSILSSNAVAGNLTTDPSPASTPSSRRARPERVNRNETARCSIYCRFSSVVGSGAFGGLIQTAVG